MTDRLPSDDDLRCIELVELLTAYLDERVDEAQRARIKAHLAGCPGCRAAVDQYRTVQRLSGRLTAADVASLDPYLRDRLIGTLRAPRMK